MTRSVGPARLALAATLALVAGPMAPGGAAAADGERGPVQVQVEAVGPAGVAGLAILSPTAEGTAVQVLVIDAPAGTSAVVHPGRCDAIDPALVALLGNVGAAGQVHATVPVPFETLTDGGHVVVFHPGLDLSTALGCGAIPATERPVDPLGHEPTPAPGPMEPPVDPVDPAASFDSPRFGFSITWGEGWQRVPVEPREELDFLALSNAVSDVHLAAYEGYGGDAAECVAEWERRVLAFLQEGRIRGLARAEGPDGQPVAGGDATRSRAGYRYTLTGDDGAEVDQVDLFECRRLSDRAVLAITLVSPGARFEAQARELEALLTGLVVPAVPAPPDDDAGVLETPAPVPPEPPPVDPVAPADPACLGVPEWVAATTAHLDRIADLTRETEGVAETLGISAYVAALATLEGELRAMVARLSEAPTPELARVVNRKAVAGLETLADTASQYVAALRRGDLAAFQRATARQREGDELIIDARREMGELQGRCASP
jgi:hypothetical protein